MTLVGADPCYYTVVGTDPSFRPPGRCPRNGVFAEECPFPAVTRVGEAETAVCSRHQRLRTEMDEAQEAQEAQRREKEMNWDEGPRQCTRLRR